MGKTGTQTQVLAVLIALGAIWGSAFILMKVLVDEISPVQIVGARLTLGALVVIVVLALQRKVSLPARGMIGPAALLCLADNTIPNTLVAWSETRIDSGLASVLMSSMPLFTMIFAVAFLKDGLSLVRGAGVAIGFFGVMVVSDGDLLKVGSSNGLALLAVVGASASHGIAAVYTKVLLRKEEPLRLTGWKLGLGALMAAPVVLVADGGGAYTTMSLKAVACLLGLGIVATGVAYSAYFWVVGRAGSVQASLVTYIIPISGLFLAWLTLSEQIGTSTIIGAAVIVAGVATAMYGGSVRLPRLSTASGGTESGMALAEKGEAA